MPCAYRTSALITHDIRVSQSSPALKRRGVCLSSRLNDQCRVVRLQASKQLLLVNSSRYELDRWRRKVGAHIY